MTAIHNGAGHRTYNFSVPSTPHTSPRFHTLSLWLVSVLMGLLALGPFLHAHYGASQATGFHVNGLQAALSAPAPAMAADSPVMSLPNEPESPAAGVVTSLPRGEVDTLMADFAPLVLLSFLVLSTLQAALCTRPSRPAPGPAPMRTFQAGFPPPAHAPPCTL